MEHSDHDGSGAFRRRLVTSSAALVTVAVVAVVMLGQPRGPSGSGRIDQVQPQPVVMPAVPVWYDDDGLHRGTEVYDVPVDPLGGPPRAAHALALAGNGALFVDPAAGDVWFQPWQGVPRVVGHRSRYGPGADPDGTTAAWFEGDELVVYDTARGRRIARKAMTEPVTGGSEHLAGNAFRYVDAEEVIWAADADVVKFDVASGEVGMLWSPGDSGTVTQLVRDVHQGWLDWARVSSDGARVTMLSGEPVAAFAEPEMFSVFSPDGRYLLAASRVGGHRAVVGEVPTGDVWFPSADDAYAWLGWSYGNVAMVLQDPGRGDGTLLGCDVEARECTPLVHRGPVLLPTS